MKSNALFRCGSGSANWAPVWAYIVTTLPIVAVQQQTLGDDWWLRVVIGVATVVASVGVVTAVHRRRRSAWSC